MVAGTPKRFLGLCPSFCNILPMSPIFRCVPWLHTSSLLPTHGHTPRFGQNASRPQTCSRLQGYDLERQSRRSRHIVLSGNGCRIERTLSLSSRNALRLSAGTGRPTHRHPSCSWCLHKRIPRQGAIEERRSPPKQHHWQGRLPQEQTVLGRVSAGIGQRSDTLRQPALASRYCIQQEEPTAWGIGSVTPLLAC